MGTHGWYVVQTKPQKELQVFRYLEDRDMEVFYPAIEVKPVNPRSRTSRPLFPRYLFVRADLDAVGISVLQWIPNAIGLVQFGGIPASVSTPVIVELKKQVSRIQAAGGVALDGLQKGDRVRITRGPLAGYEALFDMRLGGSDRVQVLLDMLGRLVKTQVEANAVEKFRH